MLEARDLKFEEASIAFEARPQTPEERLMVAVLEEALMSFARGLHSRDPIVRQDSMEVDQWVRSRCNRDLFSFESICAILQLDPDYLRAGFAAIRWRSRSAPSSQPIRKRYRTRITDRRTDRRRIR